MIPPMFVGFVAILFMGLGSWWARNRKSRWVRAGVATVVAVGVGSGAVTFYRGQVPPPATAPVTTFSLAASTDYGSLPPRATWCSGADHAWMLGGSGTITDCGSGSWDLTASGSPRTGIETGLPVYDGATVSFTGEQAAGMDSAAATYYDSGPQDQGATNAATVTVLFYDPVGAADAHILTHATSAGISVSLVSGYLVATVDNGTTTKSITSTALAQTGTWNCAVVVMDGRSTDAGKIYLNNADVTPASPDLNTGGSWAQSSATLYLWGDATDSVGMGARARMDYSAATEADAQALCGSYGLPARRDHTAYADLSWTQTGGARAFAQSATSALVASGGAPALGWSATAGHGWASEPARINRQVPSTPNCTDWICSSVTITGGQVAPDGSATAAKLEFSGGGLAYLNIAGYSSNTTVYPVIWLKCSVGDVSILSTNSSSQWTVDCSTFGGGSGAWTLLYSASQPGVSEVQPMVTSGIGRFGIRLGTNNPSGVYYVWHPTVTETPGRSVIPTTTAAVDTGDPVFALANDGTYWQSGDTVVTVIDEIAGAPCIVWGNPSSVFSGSGSPTCTGIINSIEVTR